MKRLEFLGDSLDRLREFPFEARKEAGVQLHKVQLGLDPSDWKAMTTIGRAFVKFACAIRLERFA